MNPTPENPTPSPTSRRDLTPEERALLPDFDDQPRVGETRVGETLAPQAPIGKKSATTQSEKNVLWGGALCGCFGNFVLGFILLAFERAGLKIYGPGALALIAGVILLVLLAREWPRRVILGMAAFGVSLVLSYGLLYLLLRPALNSFDPGQLPDVPPDETGHAIQAPPQNAGESNS